MDAHRLMLVHAHPDDETITTGATMAYYAARGVAVTLLTCTLGEEGEILVPALAQLESAQADQLGGLRIGELAAALGALGVTDHRFLGGAGRFRDSGMIGTPANEHPRAFWRAATEPEVFAAAVAAAVEVVRAVRPHVVITYDEFGGYGHPDHIMAHRVTSAALAAAADPAYVAGPTEGGASGTVGSGSPPAWSVPKVYWTATPQSQLRRDVAAVARRPDLGFTVADLDDRSTGCDDALVTTTIDAGRCQEAKIAALRAHRTQVLVDGTFYALSNRVGREASGVEHFRLAVGEAAGERDAEGRERDLFAGLGA